MVPPDFSSKEIASYNNYQEKIFHAKSDLNIKNPKTNISNDNKTIERIIAEQLGRLPTKVEKISVKTTFHDVFIIHIAEKKYILKISKVDNLRKSYSFLIEGYIQEKLKELSIPSVKTYAIDLSKKKYPFEYMIMEFKNGKNLEDCEEEQNLKEIFLQLGKYLSEIHSINVSNYGFIQLDSLSSKKLSGSSPLWLSFFNRNLEEHINYGFTLGLLSKEEKKRTINFLNQTISQSFTDTKPSLLHNDLGQRNILIYNGSLQAIIDWEDSILGDRLYDIAFFETFFSHSSKSKFLPFFYEGYGLDVNELYSNPLFWMYYLRVSLLKAKSKHIFGTYNATAFSIDRDRISHAYERINS